MEEKNSFKCDIKCTLIIYDSQTRGEALSNGTIMMMKSTKK